MMGQQSICSHYSSEWYVLQWFRYPQAFVAHRTQTLDTATEFLFGESVHTLRKDGSSDGAAFAEHFGVAQVESGLRFRVGSFARFYHNKRYAQAVKFTRQYVERFAQKAIDYRVAVNSGREVDEKIKQLTDHQYVFSYELSKQTLDKKEITDQLLSILLAGRDTTAGSLGTIFFLLARRPDVWSELQKEVHKLNGRRPSFEDLKSMTYLTWVINECKSTFISNPPEIH